MMAAKDPSRCEKLPRLGVRRQSAAATALWLPAEWKCRSADAHVRNSCCGRGRPRSKGSDVPASESATVCGSCNFSPDARRQTLSPVAYLRFPATA